jgi:hypothetical protein
VSDAAVDPRGRISHAIADITGLRFLPDRAPASLVNISPTGLLAESGAPFRVGSAVALSFEGGFVPEVVTGRVARCEVSVMGSDGKLRYHVGVEFDATLELDAGTVEEAAAPASGEVRNRW